MIESKITQDTFIALLQSTNREGMEALIEYMVKGGFFKSPASTRFHGCYEGGLMQHSFRVYELLLGMHLKIDFNATVGSSYLQTLPVTTNNFIIAPLLHDLCKMGAYIQGGGKYHWNRMQPKGHALLSLVRITKYISLEPIEEMMIKFHMGIYGLDEYDPTKGEYSLVSDGTGTKEERYGKSMRNAWFHNPIVKFMYFCDEIATAEDRP